MHLMIDSSGSMSSGQRNEFGKLELKKVMQRRGKLEERMERERRKGKGRKGAEAHASKAYVTLKVTLKAMLKVTLKVTKA